MYKAARQLGSEAAKFFNVRESVKFLSLLTKRKLFTLAPVGRESGCFNQFDYNHERGVYNKKYKTPDRATECAMTDVGDKKGKIKMNKNNLQQKQPNNPVAFLENKHSLLPDTDFSRFTSHFSRKRIARRAG